jgi:Tfp pilus assembly protein PilN
MQETIVGQGDLGIPEWSAADVYLELARTVPTDIKIKITDLDISDLKVRFSAETSSFEAVEQVVAALAQSHCLSKVEKSRTRQTQTGAIQFQINLEVNCGKVNESPALSLLRSSKEN